MRSLTALWLVTSLALAGCFDAHNSGGPKGSTETGNPPVIDSSAVALVVTKNEVYIIGSEGAVTPGGSALTARNVASMKVVHGKAAGDGSFELRVDGTRDDVFELRAGSGKLMSAPLFIDRGGAMVGDNDAGSLSCKQQEVLAAARITTAVANADTTCMTDDDCVLVPKSAVCLDSCSDVLVSEAGKADIEDAVNAIDDGVCGSYAEAGCMLIALPCDPPEAGAPACVRGKCELDTTVTGDQMLTCNQRVTQAFDQVDQAIANADRNCVVSNDCVWAWPETDCSGACPTDPISQAGLDDVEGTIAMINSGVCANFEQDGCTREMFHCPLIPVPVCGGGQCTTVDKLTCDERTTQAQLELRNAAMAADHECMTAADCTRTGGSTNCHVDCVGFIVSVKGDAEVTAAVDALNNSLCANFEADGCSLPGVDCFNPPVPACINGTCGEKPAP